MRKGHTENKASSFGCAAVIYAHLLKDIIFLTDTKEERLIIMNYILL
uniref:Uncharacterized protein n=1 Tax=Anguilla anguilla TaxID=7936 RepID=A0A0E9QQ24_ANGAN